VSWQDTLLDARFRGVRFDCQTVADAAKRDVQRHAYPYVAGEDTEDLGRSALDITVNAIFWGDDYEARLQTFIQALEEAGPGELIHPIFGSIEHAQVENWRIEHGADDPDSCRVTIQFCQSTAAAPFFVRQLPEQQAAQARQVARSAQGAGVETFARHVQTLASSGVSANRLGHLRGAMYAVLGFVRRLTATPSSNALDVLDFPRSFTSGLSEGFRAVSAQRAFNAVNLTSDWNAVAKIGQDTVRLPAALSTGALPPAFRAEGDTHHASALPRLHPDDQTLVESAIAVIVACELAEVACDVLDDEIVKPTLSPPEIETIVGDVRQSIQDAIDVHRDFYPAELARPVTEPLKDLALAVQDAGIAVIDTRPPLIRRTVDVPMNLHLIAFTWYGDYTRAVELARLNPHLRHPNFIAAGTVLYAYQR